MTMWATGKTRGFTLIEIMVVISLIIILVAALVANTLRVGQRAYRGATKTLLDRIDLAMGTYRDRTGFYPPDGFDGDPVYDRDAPSYPLRSSMCVYHGLGRPLVVRKPAPGGREVVERYSSPIVRFRSSELFPHPDYPAVAEIVDAWGTPLHYDRLQGPNSYSIEDSPDIHIDPPEDHPPDPRELEESAVTPGQGQNPGKYDIWSHGPAGHEVSELDEEAIGSENQIVCNWELPKSE